MRIAFAAPPVPGHLNPMMALALTLRGRGHDVMFLGIPDSEPPIAAAGLAFVPYGQQRFPPGELARRLQALSLLSGPEAFQFTFDLLGDTGRAALEDGPRAIHESGAEALVLDVVQLGFDLVAMHLKTPYVHVSNALHFDFSGWTPPCIYDWPHETTPEAFARNRAGVETYNSLTASITDIEREYAGQVGLTLDWSDPMRSVSRLAWLTQTPAAFDFPSDHWPPYLFHTGPLHAGSERVAVDFPWHRLSGEPLIYASMGTLQNGSEGVFRTIVEAAGAPGRQLVLAIGGNLDAGRIGPVPASAVIVARAPQIEVLKRASLCITHAGLNTALESLAQGVPMVAIPVTNDQPGVAARVAYTETGVVVALEALTVERLKVAVDQVLGDSRYRDNARRLQRVIQETNGLEVAADLIERAFTGQLH